MKSFFFYHSVNLIVFNQNSDLRKSVEGSINKEALTNIHLLEKRNKYFSPG